MTWSKPCILVALDTESILDLALPGLCPYVCGGVKLRIGSYDVGKGVG